MTIQAILEEAIARAPATGITFADFMELALYHPLYGYYSQNSLNIGKQGDFFTSPSLGKDLGELIAVQLLEMAEILEGEEIFTFVEMGAGVGDFAGDVINYLASHHPDFCQQLRYVIVEKSPALRKHQQQRLQFYKEGGIKITWQTWTDLRKQRLTGCFFSNELIDAFPVHRVLLQTGKLQEIYLRLEGGLLTEAAFDCSTPRLQQYFDRLGIAITPNRYPEGYCTEVNLNALDWLENISQSLARGYLLTIDYGYTAAKYYHPQRDRGTLQCYYQHRRHNHPYIYLGQQDLTAHVDFTTLQVYGEQLGLNTLGFTQQGPFLMALGLGDRLSALSMGSYSLPEILQRRDALHQAIDPAGLGGFGVLIQAKGLTASEKERSLRGLHSGLP